MRQSEDAFGQNDTDRGSLERQGETSEPALECLFEQAKALQIIEDAVIQ